MLRKFLAITLVAITSAITCRAASSILDLRREITDTAIVFPESFQTDVHKMMHNWYLQNYTMLDTTVTSPVTVTDQVIIDRLARIPTTIEMPFNQVVRSYIDMYTDRRRGLVENMLGMSLFYMPIFEEALEREGVPLELRYLPIIESALNPDAVSRAGATGLWQFMLPTARGLNLEISTLVDERRDPVRSSEAAAKYLRQLHDIYDDWSLAIAAYNCGPGNVNKAIQRSGVAKPDYWTIYYSLPAETRGYVPAFIAANYVMTYYADHNISPALARRPIVTDTVHVNHRIHFDQIAGVLDIRQEELRVLNPQYRQDVIPGDVRPYALRLPSKLVYAYIMSEDSIIAYNADRYARRTIVEPADGSGDGVRAITKVHRVKRGETMSKIASRYGVTVADIKKWNKLRSSKVKRGQKLKIKTFEAVRVEPESRQKAEAVNQPETAADSLATDTTATVAAQSEPEVVRQQAPKAPAKANTPKTRIHRVRKGETLWKIAQKYGVTVNALQKANGLNNKSKIQVGQRIKIPAK